MSGNARNHNQHFQNMRHFQTHEMRENLIIQNYYKLKAWSLAFLAQPNYIEFGFNAQLKLTIRRLQNIK